MATDVPIPGLGSIENPNKFKDQDFKKILEACLKSGKLFSDPAFPAEQQSIGMPEDPDPEKAIQWLRPKVGSPERIPNFRTVRNSVSFTQVVTVKVRFVTFGLTETR